MANRITIYQGNTVNIRTTITDQDGSVVNLTNLTVSLTIYNGTTEVLQIDNTTHTTPALVRLRIASLLFLIGVIALEN